MNESKLPPPHPGIASLHLDILSTLCDCVTERPDLLSLSLTNSIFRPLAIRALLRSRPVVLKKVATILKFHDFVFSDPTARIPHIVALVIQDTHDKTQRDPQCIARAVDALIAILRQASCLVSPQLRAVTGKQPPGYLPWHHRLSSALGEVASLRELTIEA